MVVSYTNGYGPVDPYSQQKQVNNMTTNADGGGNGGGGTFFKMFEEKESEEAKKDTSVSSNPLDDLYGMNQNYYASQNVIKDYIDNSLLLNTEQVACTNIAQHLALKGNVRDTLKFLNVQAAKNMVNSKKRNYKFQSIPQAGSINPVKPIGSKTSDTPHANFFETGVGAEVSVDNSVASNPSVNFFMR